MLCFNGDMMLNKVLNKKYVNDVKDKSKEILPSDVVNSIDFSDDKNNRKLSDTDILELVRKLSMGINIIDLAADYNIAPSSITRIKNEFLSNVKIKKPRGRFIKLTENDKLEIVQRIRKGESQTSIAKSFRIPQTYISKVKYEKMSPEEIEGSYTGPNSRKRLSKRAKSGIIDCLNKETLTVKEISKRYKVSTATVYVINRNYRLRDTYKSVTNMNHDTRKDLVNDIAKRAFLLKELDSIRTYQLIGDKYGISRQRVEQIEKKLRTSRKYMSNFSVNSDAKT